VNDHHLLRKYGRGIVIYHVLEIAKSGELVIGYLRVVKDCGYGTCLCNQKRH
jgi:hypothetical protein